MPSYFLKALENTQSILCGLLVVWGAFLLPQNCFASDSLGFSRDFCSFGGRRAGARQRQKGKKLRKGWLSDVSALVNRRLRPYSTSAQLIVSVLFQRVNGCGYAVLLGRYDLPCSIVCAFGDFFRLGRGGLFNRGGFLRGRIQDLQPVV